MSFWITRITTGFGDSAYGKRLHFGLLAIITLLALVLRFYKLGEWSFWIDEIFTINRAQAHYSNLAVTLNNVPPHTNWIPISLLLISSVIGKLGVSEWSVRLVPALIGVLSIPILYFPIRKIFDPTVALLSVLLLAISPWHILWSQNGRFYVTLMLLYNLTLIVLYFGLEYDRPAYLLLAWPLFYLAMSERMLAGFVVPVIAVYLVSIMLFGIARPPGFKWRNILILLIPVLAGVLIEAYGRLSAGYSRFLGDADAFIGNSVDSPARILILIFLSVGLPIVVLGLFTGGWLTLQRDRRGLFLFVSATVPVALLIGISPWVFVSERYTLITLPAWLILTAIAIKQLALWLPKQGNWLIVAMLAVLFVDAAGSHLMYYELNNGNRPDWRGAFAYVGDHKAPNDLVITSRPEIGRYYLGVNPEILDLAEVNPEQMDSENRPIWFVVDSEAVWYASETTHQWMEKNARLLFVWYLRMREQIHMKVYYYRPCPENIEC